MNIEHINRLGEDRVRLARFIKKESNDKARILSLRLLGEVDVSDSEDYALCEALINEFRAGIHRIDQMIELQLYK